MIVIPALLILLIAILYQKVRVMNESEKTDISGKKTVSDRLSEYSEQVDRRLSPVFSARNVPYPPQEFTLIAIKSERSLELHAKNALGHNTLVLEYPILAASGHPGPKLQEGDRQVPEGIYGIEYLNPNSLYHLSMKISYPNDFDKMMAALDNRSNLGGDIMIHGNQVSIGCIAVGDQASEDLFVLASRADLKKIKVLISPVDFRKKETELSVSGLPTWTSELYNQIRAELRNYENDI